MKKCKQCDLDKDQSEFYGVQGECKECTKLRVKKNSAKVGRKYDFSELGVIRIIYTTQKRHNNLRGHGDMLYSKQELCCWLYDRDFKRIFNDWVDSGYKKDLKPSVDRIDDLKGYSFNNIRLVTWLENRKHQYQDIINGVGSSGRRCKKLYKFDSQLNPICSYVSYNSGARDIGYSIEYQIKKKVKCRSGFYWSYSRCF
jgi:hypothetical protein